MNKKNIIIVIIVLILLVAAGGFWKWKNNQKVGIVQQNNQAENQEQSQLQPQIVKNTEGELVWYEIPEMNIKFKIDKEIAGELIYKFEGKGGFGSALFSSKELSKIPGCSVEAAPLGALGKIKGTPYDYSDEDYFISRKPKQLNNFFIIYNGPQAVCAGAGMGDDARKLEKYFEENPKFQGWIIGPFETIEIIDKK